MDIVLSPVGQEILSTVAWELYVFGTPSRKRQFLFVSIFLSDWSVWRDMRENVESEAVSFKRPV